VHVITRRRLSEFAQRHPACRSALDNWYRIVRHGSFSSLADIRRVLPSADQVGPFTVFNVGGNKARLIAVIHFNRAKLYIRQVLTHAEYDRGHWKD
jgi:mRNA interferase HigB